MTNCTVTTHLKIVDGTLADYKSLAHFHYRSGALGPVAAVYKIVNTLLPTAMFNPVVGVIVYSMPAPALQLRNIATDGLFSRIGSRTMAMRFVNDNVRCICRVVLEPRYRGLGLAQRLIVETMDKLNVPYIETLAVMGKVNPFFEKAGMLKFEAKPSGRCVKMTEILSVLGIEGNDFVDTERVNVMIESLPARQREFLERRIRNFLAAYGRKGRKIQHCLERTEMILNKLSSRPMYYLWRNPQCKLKI